MITALSQLIGDYFFNSFASIKLIKQRILGLVQVRDVNLTWLALRIKGDKQESRYKKLQSFLPNVNHHILGELQELAAAWQISVLLTY